MAVHVTKRQLTTLKRNYSAFKRPAPKLREADVVKQCIDYLTYEGWFCIRLQSGLFYAKGGKRAIWVGKDRPDWICLHPAHGHVFLELKAPGKKPTAGQALWMALRRREGYKVEWFDSLEDLKGWMAHQLGGECRPRYEWSDETSWQPV